MWVVRPSLGGPIPVIRQRWWCTTRRASASMHPSWSQEIHWRHTPPVGPRGATSRSRPPADRLPFIRQSSLAPVIYRLRAWAGRRRVTTMDAGARWRTNVGRSGTRGGPSWSAQCTWGRLVRTVVIHILIAWAALVLGVRPGRRGAVTAHVLLSIEEAHTAASNVVGAVTPVLLHDAVDACRVPGGRGGRRPPPPEAHAENRALREAGEGRYFGPTGTWESWKYSRETLQLRGPTTRALSSTAERTPREKRVNGRNGYRGHRVGADCDGGGRIHIEKRRAKKSGMVFFLV